MSGIHISIASQCLWIRRGRLDWFPSYACIVCRGKEDA